MQVSFYFQRVDSERNNIVQNNNNYNNYSFIKKKKTNTFIAPQVFCDSAQKHLCGCTQSSTWSIQRGRHGGSQRDEGGGRSGGGRILSLLLKVCHCPPRHQMPFS